LTFEPCAGYSDQILRFIAERGDGDGLLTFVENIHVLYKLEDKLREVESKEKGFTVQEHVDDSRPSKPHKAASSASNVHVELVCCICLVVPHNPP
jgi:hypothetical protein